MSEKRKYDSTIARIAGNILSGHAAVWNNTPEELGNLARGAVLLARAIVAEVERTEAPAVCVTCQGRGWIMRTLSQLGGGLSVGGAGNEPCPDCTTQQQNRENPNINGVRPSAGKTP